MMFDTTITLGNVLTIAAMAIAGFGFIWSMKSELKTLGARLERVEGIMSKLTDALVQLARQEARLDAHAQRIGRIEQSETRP